MLRMARISLFIIMTALLGFGGEQAEVDPMTKHVTQGALRISQADGAVVQCPLKHTDVQAQISGFVARVRVTQTFLNPLDEKIEAVYVFPLPHKSAVDDMTMVIGDRKVVGIIKRRAEARQIYEQALARGQRAALLEQERPNIFTQSVANIGPKQEIKIEISYVDVLEYDMGVYTFHFPMGVGPRFIPGGTTTPEGGAKPVPRVPDADRITPPYIKPTERNGHDISLALALDAGVHLRDLKSTNHQDKITSTGDTAASISITPADSFPNKDFVLKYKVVGEKPEMAVLTHTDLSGGGYFMLMVQPKEDERLKQSPPREICFLIDISGSMSGRPTEVVRNTMQHMLKLCKPQDSVQVVTFAGQAKKLFEKPVPVTNANISKALSFTRRIRGGGGTHMLKGIKMAINQPLDPKRVRIVIMLTDGFIGNEAEIIAEVGRSCGDHIRFWCMGIGSSVNRFLVDGVAKQGGGMSKVLGLNDPQKETAQEIMMRIHRAQLADIRIDWGGLWVFETYPAKRPELWAGRPVVVFGRYEAGGIGNTIKITGKVEGEPAEWPLTVDLPTKMPDNEVLEKVWARRKIEDLMHQTYYQGSPEVEETVTQIALDYRLMSQYTSFVAVDEADAGDLTETARPPRRMLVPVPIPEGTRYEGFFGAGGGGTPGEFVDEFALEHVKESGFRMSLSGGRGGRGRLRAMPRMPGKDMSRRAGIYFAIPPAQPGRVSVPRPTSLSGGRMLGLAAKTTNGLARVERERRPVFTGTPMRRGSLAMSEVHGRGWGYVYERILADQQGETLKRAANVMKRAEEMKKKDATQRAKAMFAYAYLLDQAAGGAKHSAKALEAIEQINSKLVETWAKETPALKKKLNLVIRDKSFKEAISAIAGASGLKISLKAGSIEDARTILNRKDLRVTFLDLRHATTSQALDWLLTPVRMTWTATKGTVLVGTARRGNLKSAWVYDVSILALPLAEETKKIKESRKRSEFAKSNAEEFMRGVRVGLAVDDAAACWYAPGQLLLAGDADLHERAVKLFDDLSRLKPEMREGLKQLQRVTSNRASQRKDLRAKMIAANEKARVYDSIAVFSWRLLAAAAGGELDLEALTELQIAWNHPATAGFLKGKGTVAALRSAWAIGEASRALPKNAELAQLAKSVRKKSRKAAENALELLKESPEDIPAFFKALYGAMALSDDAGYVGKARALLKRSKAKKSPLAPMRTIAAGLLAPAKEIDRKGLEDVIRAGVRGDDAIVLSALACRRAGGDLWSLFRAEARRLLGGQPLSGDVIVLVNSLGKPGLPIVAAAK